MSFRIASFNVLRLSGKQDKKRDDSKAFAHIAEIIKKERIDLMALQELDTVEGLQGIRRHLGTEWQGVHASVATKDNRADEYGFIWNARRLSRVSDPLVCSEIEKRVDYLWSSHIHTQIRIAEEVDEFPAEQEDETVHDEYAGLSTGQLRERIIEHYKAQLCRPPLVCCFRPVRWLSVRPIEIRIINTHIRHAKYLNGRLEEYKQLAGRIHTAMNTLRTGSFRTVYTLLMGDYNLALGHLEGVDSDERFVESCENHLMTTVQGRRTTLAQYDESAGNQPQGEDCYAHSYDHFTFDEKRVNPLASPARRIDFTDFKTHRTEISDHVPVVIDLNL